MDEERLSEISMVFLVLLVVSSLLFFDFSYQGLVFSDLENTSFNIVHILFSLVIVLLIVVLLVLRKKVMLKKKK